MQMFDDFISVWRSHRAKVRKAKAWQAVADAMIEYPDIAADVVGMVQAHQRKMAKPYDAPRHADIHGGWGY